MEELILALGPLVCLPAVLEARGPTMPDDKLENALFKELATRFSKT